MPERSAAVLITRPTPDGATLAEHFAPHNDVSTYLAPMTEIVDVEGAELNADNADAVLLTSARAVPRALAVKHLPTYTVGMSTAMAAHGAGYNVTSIGPGRADERLVNLVPPDTRLLHPAGVHLSRDLAAAFETRGIHYDRVPVYEARAVTEWPAEARDFFADDREKFVTFMSARAVTVFADLGDLPTPPAGSPELTAVCASERIAEAARSTKVFHQIHVTGSVEASRFVDFIALRRT
ncbi:MAG: uroporphyrinogen-III synthase [Parvularculaceae bacterium]|nr:uroporphyrinogen-III synthase [Parvularculaceae bacterium]